MSSRADEQSRKDKRDQHVRDKTCEPVFPIARRRRSKLPCPFPRFELMFRRVRPSRGSGWRALRDRSHGGRRYTRSDITVLSRIVDTEAGTKVQFQHLVRGLQLFSKLNPSSPFPLSYCHHHAIRIILITIIVAINAVLSQLSPATPA